MKPVLPPKPTDTELSILRVLWRLGPATVRAIQDCELLVIDKSAMTSVLKLQPEFVNRIVQILEDRQAELNKRLAESSNPSPPQKEPLLDIVKRYFGLD